MTDFDKKAFYYKEESMKLKKTLSAILAGLMLAGGAVAASADGKVYTAEDFAPVYKYQYNCAPYYPYYNNGYFYNWIYDRGPVLQAVWNPVTNTYDNCVCAYCSGHADLTGYYWVNGVLCSAKDYYVNYAPHTVTVTPDTSKEVSKETGVTYYESSIPSVLVKRKPSASAEKEGNVIITDSGNVTVKNPSVIGGYNKHQTVLGTYYASDKVDLNSYFNTNMLSLNLTQGEVQTFGTGFKMISADNTIVKVITDSEGQKLIANGVGTTSVYLYTGGGVPFMKLSVTVVNSLYGAYKGYIDVEVGSWRLDKVGDSTPIVVAVDKEHCNDTIKLSVVKGDGYIKDGKLYANGNGAIVVKAYSEKNPNIKGYAIVYVGQYVDALYDGYWTNVNGNISCNYWNPYLWGCDGYKINGWILTNTGAYLPVISKVETTTTKPDGDKVTTTTTVYSDLYDLLYGDCHGNVDTLYELLWKNGKLTDKNLGALYNAALQEIVEDITADYFAKMH